MLKKTQRLTTKEFNDVFTHGKKRRLDNFLYIKLRQEKTMGYSRFAVVVSKKKIKLAVQRSKQRRLVYKAIKESKNIFNTESDYILIIQKKIDSFDEVKESILKYKD